MTPQTLWELFPKDIRLKKISASEHKNAWASTIPPWGYDRHDPKIVSVHTHFERNEYCCRLITPFPGSTVSPAQQNHLLHPTTTIKPRTIVPGQTSPKLWHKFTRSSNCWPRHEQIELASLFTASKIRAGDSGLGAHVCHSVHQCDRQSSNLFLHHPFSALTAHHSPEKRKCLLRRGQCQLIALSNNDSNSQMTSY